MKIEENNYTKGWLVYPLIQSANQDEIAVYVTENEENEANLSIASTVTFSAASRLAMPALFTRPVFFSDLSEMN